MNDDLDAMFACARADYGELGEAASLRHGLADQATHRAQARGFTRESGDFRRGEAHIGLRVQCHGDVVPFLRSYAGSAHSGNGLENGSLDSADGALRRCARESGGRQVLR